MEARRSLNDKELSLAEFVNQNDKLLSALGVFFAIVAFSKVTNNWALGIVTFASLCGSLLILYEVFTKLREKMAFTLVLFRYTLILLGIGITLYWISEFRHFWDAFLWVPTEITLLFYMYLSLLPIVRRFKLTRWLLGIDSYKKTLFHKIVRAGSLLIILIASIIYAVPISVVVNYIFDAIKK